MTFWGLGIFLSCNRVSGAGFMAAWLGGLWRTFVARTVKCVEIVVSAIVKCRRSKTSLVVRGQEGGGAVGGIASQI